MLPPPESSPLSSLSLPDLLSSISPIRRASHTFHNWARTYSSTTLATFYPTSVEEVRRVVETARREGRELRVFGSGHSPSDLGCTEGYGMSLDGVGKVLEIDPSTNSFHVEGGIKLHALNVALSQASPPLALSSLGSISDQSLAGALSTATHGSGIHFGNLSTFVIFLDLVLPLPDAPIRRVSRESPDQADRDLFLAALCGLGAVGVVVGVGMKAEPAFRLEEEQFTLKWEVFVERWEEISERADHVTGLWFPQVGEVIISSKKRTTKAITPSPPILTSFVTNQLLGKHYHALALSLARYFPNILPFHARFMYALQHRPAPIATSAFWRGLTRIFRWSWWNGAEKLEGSKSDHETRELKGDGTTPTVAQLQLPQGVVPPLTPPGVSSGTTTSHLDESMILVNPPLPQLTESVWQVDDSVKIFNYDCGFPQYTYEGAVPYANTRATLVALEKWATKELNDPKGLRGHFPIEIRFTEKDDIWLSPTYGMRATYIGAIQYRPFNLSVPYKLLFRAFESILLSQSGRPHWAKSHNCSRTQLEQMYPKFNDFVRVQKEVDPEGVLVNAYLKRHLWGMVGEEVDMRRFKSSRR